PVLRAGRFAVLPPFELRASHCRRIQPGGERSRTQSGNGGNIDHTSVALANREKRRIGEGAENKIQRHGVILAAYLGNHAAGAILSQTQSRRVSLNVSASVRSIWRASCWFTSNTTVSKGSVSAGCSNSIHE